MFKHKNRKKGQSTLEYLILVTGVVAIMIVFLGPGGIFQQAVNETYITGTSQMNEMANRLATSRPLSP